MCGTPLRVEPEHLLDEGTMWIADRWTESVGLMYSADGGIMHSRTRGLSPTAGILWLCWHTAMCESANPQNTLGRIRRLPSILCWYIHLLIYIQFASGAMKTVHEHSMAPAGWFGRAYTPLQPPRSTSTVCDSVVWIGKCVSSVSVLGCKSVSGVCVCSRDFLLRKVAENVSIALWFSENKINHFSLVFFGGACLCVI